MESDLYANDVFLVAGESADTVATSKFGHLIAVSYTITFDTKCGTVMLAFRVR